jgi:hypothetical protein
MYPVLFFDKGRILSKDMLRWWSINEDEVLYNVQLIVRKSSSESGLYILAIARVNQRVFLGQSSIRHQHVCYSEVK